MHKLTINKLGPIEFCELECSPFITLTGFQASGKSTIAKAIYYFRTIKEDIVELAERQALNKISYTIDGLFEDEFDIIYGEELNKGLENYLRRKFVNTFGTLWGMSDEMYMEYRFSETCFVRISLKRDSEFGAFDRVWIVFSEELKRFLQEKNNCFSVTSLGVPEGEKKQFKGELYKIFDDHCMVVYIPAGRSMITLLSQQLSYIYAQMGDGQKRSLDSCIRDYLERILRIKQEFSEGLQGLAALSQAKTLLPPKTIHQALHLIKKILQGTYRCNNGEEQIVLDDGNCIKINFASSGQQECVWILNLLFYYLLQPRKVLFIIEEPESHLFPESQKYITELIALVSNCRHSVLLTTHSPYVLGTLNNLLYAHTIPSPYVEKAGEIIPEIFWINFKEFTSWFVKNGSIEDGMDWEIHMIQNEKIDEISKVINNDFEQLLDLQETDEEGMIV